MVAATVALPEVGRGPKVYLAKKDFISLVGFKEQRSFYNIWEKDLLVEPDIWIGDAPGWDPERVFNWAVETGRLAHDGAPLKKKAGRLPKTFQRPDWWHVEIPERYLTSSDAARELGIEPNSLYFLRERGTFIEPDVLIGDRPGWRRERVIEFGKQSGRLTLEGTPTRRAGRPPKERDDAPDSSGQDAPADGAQDRAQDEATP